MTEWSSLFYLRLKHRESQLTVYQQHTHFAFRQNAERKISISLIIKLLSLHYIKL